MISGAGLCWQHVGGVGSTTTTTTCCHVVNTLTMFSLSYVLSPYVMLAFIMLFCVLYSVMFYSSFSSFFNQSINQCLIPAFRYAIIYKYS